MCVHVKPSPFTVTMLIGWTVAGALLLLSAFLPIGVSTVIPSQPPWAEASIGASMLAGGCLALYSTHYSARDLTRKWRLDELGMWLMAGGWATYALIAFLEMPMYVVHWELGLTSFLGSLVRIADIRRHRGRVESAVKRLIVREAG